MPTPAATQAASNKGTDKNAPAVRLIPFTRAAVEHVEPFFDASYTPNANTQQVGPIDVPAYGYMRHLVLLVQATGGSGTAAVAQADAPFSILNDISLQDVNGAQIIGPISGYDLYLSNKYFGVKRPISDPKQRTSFSAVANTGNFSFALRLPVEICNRDGLGALGNQNAASTFKLKFSISPKINAYSTDPTVMPSVRVRGYLEAWTQPAGANLQGMPQSTTPPAHGTTAFISKNTWGVPLGSSTQRLTRVGNYIRGLIFVNRNVSGVRVDSSWPDPMQISWDTRLLQALGVTQWKDLMNERHQLTGTLDGIGGLDTGVYVYDFCHEFDGRVGEELRDGWLPTLQSTRLDVFGNWGAAANVDVITQDVSPAGEVFV